ncbi:MAG TPA: hypothetical protein VFT31_10985 [Kribbella sp.]|nr:hypothetical protein [Kribbella sp.]
MSTDAAAGTTDGWRKCVELAVDLGWQMVETYRDAKPKDLVHPDHVMAEPAGLTNFAQLDHRHRLRLDVHGIDRAVTQLAALLPPTRIAPSTQAVRDGVEQLAKNDYEAATRLLLSINQLNVDLLTWLHAADSRTGEAYRLGRILAGTSRPGSGDDPVAVMEVAFFGKKKAGRKDIQIRATLDHLAGLLPLYMGGALRLSFERWAETVTRITAGEEQRRRLLDPDPEPQRRKQKPAVGNAPVVVPDEATMLTYLGRHLGDQGKIWRDMLTGRLDCARLLTEDDYVAAAEVVLRKDREIALATSRRLLWTLLVPLLGAVAVIAVIAALSTAGSPSVRIIAALVALGGALAATWRAVAGLTRQATTRINDPIYERALTARIAERATNPLDKALDKAREHRPGRRSNQPQAEQPAPQGVPA